MNSPWRCFLVLAVATNGLVQAAAVRAADQPKSLTPSPTDWLKEARLGAFMHFLPGDAASFAKVNDFDVEALARQLEGMGAKYFVFTFGQNSGWFNSPNAAYDGVTGYQPGERCSRRDLPLDLYRALHAKGIRLMLYLPCQTPNRDTRAQRAFGLKQGPKDQPIDVAFAKRWAEVIHEWSARYGDKVSGWWFDGGYAWIGFNEDIARIYADAVKRGNPRAIVTFNPGVRLLRHTQAEDYTAGELNDPFAVVPTSRWVDGSQWHALTFLGSAWGRRDVRQPTDRWRAWFQKVAAHEGAVTLDMGPNWNPEAGPIGAIAPAQAEQFKAISQGSAAPDGDRPLPRPTPEQAAWQDMELGMFYHFDISTFTDGGEGDWPRQGHLDPNLYNPAKLNTDQWLEAAKAMGACYTVFVAKHCTGFISWQSDAYPYGVRQSKWRGGKGDVVADYVASSRKYDIKPGIYCSMPANAYCEVFGNCTVKGATGPNDPRQVEYRRRAERLVTELWGNYGPLTYIWFDGGTLPPGKGGPDLVPILKRLQPHAVTFQGPPDNPAGNTRWPGNEKGITAYPSWSTVAQANDCGAGDPRGNVWQPGECDAPLRNHAWFWHPNDERKIRSVDELVEMYYQSVGRGCNLILNGNIDRDGLVPEADLKRFREFGDEIRRRFAKSIAETTGRGKTVELTLAKPTVIDHAILMEQITDGQRIRQYVIEGLAGGQWQELGRGQSIGHKRIERFRPVEVTKVRIRATEAVAEPVIRKLAVYHVGSTGRPKPAASKSSGWGVRQVLVDALDAAPGK